MSRFVVGGFVLRSKLILIAALIFAPAMAEAAAGDLDSSFGIGGVVEITNDTPLFEGSGIAVQPDGKILVATASGTHCAVLRFLPNGTADASFGGTGAVEPDLGVTSSACTGLAVQPDGRIVAVAHLFDTPSAGLVSYAVVRLLADGTLDPSWAGTGVATVTIGTGAPSVVGADEQGPDLALQGDGSVLIVGAVDDAIAVARFTATGGLDATFGDGGTVLADVSPGGDGGAEIAVQTDGKIVVAGTHDVTDFAIVRLLADGALDPTFGAAGLVVDSGLTGVDGLAIQGDGKVVVAGGTGFFLHVDVTVVRLLPSGALDVGFGTGGRSSFEPENAVPTDLALQPDGRILVSAGSATNGFDPTFAIVRFTPAGAVDLSWGTRGDGLVKTPFSVINIAYALAVQKSDGKVLVVGRVANDLPGGRLVRYENDVATPADCGNGALDAGEECDDGNAANGDCCSFLCTFDAVGTVCGPTVQCSGSVCDGAGGCDEGELLEGAPCENGSTCTVDACQAGVCVSTAAPMPLCKQQTVARGTLLISDNDNDARDKLNWSWLRGAETSPEEVPQQDYDLCVFDASVATQPRTALQTNGDTCGPFPCWKLKGTQPIYVDAVGNHDGLRQILLKPGVAGKSTIKVLARGANLPLPPLPLVPPVRVQLQSESGDCWEATYSDPKKNDGVTFKASPDE